MTKKFIHATRDRLTQGFSLIEMLVVIVMFAVLSILVTQSTLQSFRGTRKADASGKVRDNLEFTSSVLERHLRNAKSITSTCDGTSMSALNYVDEWGLPGSFSCLGGSNLYLASGSANVRISSTDVRLISCSFVCSINSVVNPANIDIILSAVTAGSPSSDASFTTVTKRVSLRVY